MLALRPSPPDPHHPDPLARRGRSRQVPDSALARQASDERRSADAVHAVQHKFFVTSTDRDRDLDTDDEPAPAPPAASSSRPLPSPEPTLVGGSHASPSPGPLGYHSQQSSLSSIHSALSTPSTSSTMLSIAAPVPLKAAFPPPFMRSASPSPPSSASMSPDYYDSPPSPPRSLEDQVHVAYALDDIHLAKILLLRLKGIEVTSDDDPRIAAVQDEDFDFCFVPNGGLMDERDEKAMQEMQAREMALIEQRRREKRLRDCERKFIEEKRRMRDERMAVLQRRERQRQEEEAARRQALEKEQRRAAEEERERLAHERAAVADMHRAAQRSRSRKVVSYRFLQTPPPNSRPKPFVYDFPGYSTRSSKPQPATPASTLPQPSFDDSCAVPFSDVLKSMQGALFPPSHADRPRRSDSPALSKSSSRTHSQAKRRREARLLEALLVDIEYSEDERRKRKGKQPANPRRISAPCLACSTSSSISSLSASSTPPTPTIRRTSSWLSFRGGASSSASSSTTDLTTPSSSPISTSKAPWFIRPKSAISDAVIPPTLFHSCRQRTRLMPVTLSDSPLYIDTPPPTRLEPLSHLGRQRSTSTARAAREGAGVLVRRMSKFVELAKGLQTAYANAALFSGAAAFDGFEDRETPSDRSKEDRSRTPPVEDVLPVAITPRQRGSRPKLRPAGYRVAARDVAKFLDPTPNVVGSPATDTKAGTNSSTMGRYIPLTSPFKPTEVPRTVLPDPLPYKLVFKRVLSPSRSPFRFHALSELHTMYPSSAPSPPHMTGQVTWRIRSVGNPVHMRLKALHNVVRKGGMKWEGNGTDTALGGGRERVIGVAYENLGATMLNRSSSSASL